MLAVSHRAPLAKWPWIFGKLIKPDGVLDVLQVRVDDTPGPREVRAVVRQADLIDLEPDIVTNNLLQFWILGFEQQALNIQLKGLFADVAGLPVVEHRGLLVFRDDRTIELAIEPAIGVIESHLAGALDADSHLGLDRIEIERLGPFLQVA